MSKKQKAKKKGVSLCSLYWLRNQKVNRKLLSGYSEITLKVFGLFPAFSFLSWAPSVSGWIDGCTPVCVCTNMTIQVCEYLYCKWWCVFWSLLLQTYGVNILQQWGIFWEIIRHWCAEIMIISCCQHGRRKQTNSHTHTSMKRFRFSGKDTTKKFFCSQFVMVKCLNSLEKTSH